MFLTCFWPVSDLFSIGASLNVLLTWKHLRGFCARGRNPRGHVNYWHGSGLESSSSSSSSNSSSSSSNSNSNNNSRSSNDTSWGGWMDGWMDRCMLGKCCLFGVSDLFLTCFWPFPESSSTSKKSARVVKLRTILVIVKIITSAPNISTSTSASSSSSSTSSSSSRRRSNNSSNSNSRSSNNKNWGGWMDRWIDRWMDRMLGKCCHFGVSDLFLTCFQLELAWMSFWPEKNLRGFRV